MKIRLIVLDISGNKHDCSVVGYDVGRLLKNTIVAKIVFGVKKIA